MADTSSKPAASAEVAASPQSPSSPPKSVASPNSPSSPPPEPELAAPLEVDEEDEVNDPTLDGQLSSFTASLSSSVLDYPVEHGRRYHAYRKGSYLFPNDDREAERLDVMHQLTTQTIGGLYLAPVDKEIVHNILDIGTGTGSLAIELAEEFPNARVLGCDLSPIQPSWVPPNVQFEVDDVESEWLYPFKFDLIINRCMAGSIGDWNALSKKIYDNLTPGGWVEFQDYDIDYRSDDRSLTEDHHFRKWNKVLVKALTDIDRDPCPGPKLRSYAEKAGFVNIREEVFKVPLGPWAKDPYLKHIGMINLVQMLDGLEAFSLKVFDMIGYSEAETQVLLAKVRDEVKGRAFHAYEKIHVVYGQKPESTT
ncbi:related to methyltransferase [Cephalotrichum gorgonifer]|uniref:Related to methyltransferase n=1 Tax=Cephalotrichum gorgonifer TaxID=2041049 RepID=A0AAE8N2C1_9PEZI|nr:related to methyltransferase [Cephalotrichum gorgonifer]